MRFTARFCRKLPMNYERQHREEEEHLHFLQKFVPVDGVRRLKPKPQSPKRRELGSWIRIGLFKDPRWFSVKIVSEHHQRCLAVRLRRE